MQLGLEGFLPGSYLLLFPLGTPAGEHSSCCPGHIFPRLPLGWWVNALSSSCSAVLFLQCRMGFPRGTCIFALGGMEQGPAWISGLQPGLQGFHSPVPSVRAPTVACLFPISPAFSLGCYSGLLRAEGALFLQDSLSSIGNNDDKSLSAAGWRGGDRQ